RGHEDGLVGVAAGERGERHPVGGQAEPVAQPRGEPLRLGGGSGGAGVGVRGHMFSVSSSSWAWNRRRAASRRVGTCSVGTSTGWYRRSRSFATVTRCTSSGPS